MLPYIPISGTPPLLSPPPAPHLHTPPLPTEEQFMDDFMLFSNATGVRLSEQDFLIEGHLVNPWKLHRLVSARKGFDLVTMNGEWPAVGVELGFPQIAWGYPDQWALCSPAVAHQLQQLYQDTLRHFDQAYSCGMIAQLRNSLAPVQVQAPSLPPPPPPPVQPLAYQRTEANYQTPLASATTTSQSSIETFQSILPRFCDASSAELEAYPVPQHVIASIEQNRERSKCLASYPQVPDDFAPTESPQLGRQNLLYPADGLQIASHPPLQNFRGGRQQQSDSDSGLGSRMGQNLDSPGMGLLQGLGSPEYHLFQPPPSLPHENAQPSHAPSASRPQPEAQQASGPGNLSAMSIPQLRALSSQLLQVVMESEKNLPAAGSSGESDIQRQIRLKIENNKRYLRMLQEIISARMRASGDSMQPLNSVLTQTNGSPPQSLPITHSPSQHIQPNKIPPLSEDRFKICFMQFIISKGIRLNEGDLVIEGRSINLWALHRTVFMRNGFDSVSARDEWPVIGAALGLPTTGDASRPPRCAPAIANRLRLLHNEVLRPFDQIYISSFIARLRSSQASGQLAPQPPQPQAQLHQPTEADYQALLGSTSESSVMDSEAMSILPRFAHASGADLEAHHVPAHVIALVEQNREHLQRAAQDQNEFRARLTSIKSESRTQVNHVSPHQEVALQYSYQQLQRLQRPGLARGSGKPSMLQPAQLFNSDRPLVPPSTVQSISPSITAQITGSNSSGGVRDQGGSMSVSMNPTATNGVISGLILTQSTGAVHIRRPTQEELINAKRRVDEKRRVAFSCAPGFDGAISFPPIPECDIQEYHRNVERLDQVLSSIEKYIHFAFAVLKKEEIVERMFTMMASVKIQMEELKKPNPRYVLELHAIRGMIQEVDNMDKGLKAVLQRTQAQVMPPDGATSAPQLPPQPPSAATNHDLPQGDESAPSPEGATPHHESLSEVVRIAMAKLEIR